MTDDSSEDSGHHVTWPGSQSMPPHDISSCLHFSLLREGSDIVNFSVCSLRPISPSYQIPLLRYSHRSSTVALKFKRCALLIPLEARIIMAKQVFLVLETLDEGGPLSLMFSASQGASLRNSLHLDWSVEKVTPLFKAIIWNQQGHCKTGRAGR